MIANPSFETAGTGAGQAESWSTSESTSAWRLAGFTGLDATERGTEQFSWFAWVALFALVLQARASFNTIEPREDFANGWLDAAFATDWEQLGVTPGISDGFDWTAWTETFVASGFPYIEGFLVAGYLTDWQAGWTTHANFSNDGGSSVREQFDEATW